METSAIAEGAGVRRGGEWQRWDLQLCGGILGAARVRAAVEEHGGGRQLVRFRVWPVVSRRVALSPALGALALLAAMDGAVAAAGVLGTLSVGVVARAWWE